MSDERKNLPDGRVVKVVRLKMPKQSAKPGNRSVAAVAIGDSNPSQPPPSSPIGLNNEKDNNEEVDDLQEVKDMEEVHEVHNLEEMNIVPDVLKSGSAQPEAPSVKQSNATASVKKNKKDKREKKKNKEVVKVVAKRSPYKTSRAGVQNFSNEEMQALLDLAETRVPLGMQEWALVAHDYNKWAMKNKRSQRDSQALKSKFDRLADTTKPTGRSGCPDIVRKAKDIAADMEGRSAAAPLGTVRSNPSEEAGEDDVAEVEQRSRAIKQEGNAVGVRADARTAGRSGVKRQDVDAAVVSHM